MRKATLYLLLVGTFALAGCKKDASKTAGMAASQPKVIRVETANAVKHTFSGRLPITGELKPLPVSYTHLDVYKRQSTRRSLNSPG